jgi:hypothetical protein
MTRLFLSIIIQVVFLFGLMLIFQQEPIQIEAYSRPLRILTNHYPVQSISNGRYYFHTLLSSSLSSSVILSDQSGSNSLDRNDSELTRKRLQKYIVKGAIFVNMKLHGMILYATRSCTVTC